MSNSLFAIRKGALLGEANEKLAELTQECVELGKPGELTIKVKIKPTGIGEQQLQVTDDVTATMPRPDRRTTVVWADGKGNLHRNPQDAEQDDARPLRAVEKEA